MARLITDAQAQYAYEHSQLVSGPGMRAELTAEWQTYIEDVRARAWLTGWHAGMNYADALNNGTHDTHHYNNPFTFAEDT